MSDVTSNSIPQLCLKLLVEKASVCSMYLSTATAVYNANPPHAGSHPLRLGRLLMPYQPHTAFVLGLMAGRVEDDITDFSSVSEPAATASAPTAPQMILGTKKMLAAPCVVKSNPVGGECNPVWFL
jgi:hypothetical protein